MTTKAATREQWLRNVARAMEPKFAALDAPLCPAHGEMTVS